MPKSSRTAPRLTSLSQLLNDNNTKVHTSSELIELLGKSGVTGDNARQIIRRRAKADGLWRSEKLRLANNERLFAGASTLKTPGFLMSVSEKLGRTKRKGMARCVAALSERHVLNKIEVIRLLAVSPVQPRGAAPKRLYEGELEGLKELGI